MECIIGVQSLSQSAGSLLNHSSIKWFRTLINIDFALLLHLQANMEGKKDFMMLRVEDNKGKALV